MINECIILAGGLGTRLRDAVPDLPKCMAPVSGKPFLLYVIRHLYNEGIRRFIFSLGFKHEVIVEYLQTNFAQEQMEWVIEETPLGTGGAIKLACEKVSDKNVLVVNGDTLFTIKIGAMAYFHSLSQAHCTLALKPMTNFDRYGVVELNSDFRISSFREKQFYESGLINGGVYALNTSKFMEEDFPEKFSFEKDYLEKFYTTRPMFGIVQDEYFIDIGVPEDYERANRQIKNI